MTHEEMISKYFARTVNTGFSDTEKGIKILSHVLGQMSDGIWEESNAITGYWLCAHLNSDGNLQIATTYNSPESHYKCKNPYRKMSDNAIRAYFANKIKQVVRINLKHNYEAGIYHDILAKHGLEDRYIIPAEKKEYDMVADETKKYLSEHPFTLRGLFNKNNGTTLTYLSDYKGAEITVSDAYNAYKSLVVA